MEADLLEPPAAAPAPRPLSRVAAAFDPAAVVAAIPAQPEPGRSRRWALLYRDAELEAWAIAWPAGTGLPLHDHDGSRAGVHVVAGRLRERYVDSAVGPEGGPTGPAPIAVRWWGAGERYELPADHVHEVVNVTADEAVSVHVYSPPLGDIRFREG